MRRALCLLLAGAALAGCRQASAPAADPTANLATSIAAIRAPDPATRVDCATLVNPLVLLVMGQSNAGNHGALGTPGAPAGRQHTLFGNACFASADPLPGATGDDASIWSRLPAIAGRPILLVPIAVESTAIAQWTTPGPLRAYVDARLKQLGEGPFKVDLVLWQQGEADAKAHTAQTDYVAGLAGLRVMLDAHQIRAPLLAARSTYCPGSDGKAVRAAVGAGAGIARIAEGPDMDGLQGVMRSGGCHFSARGLAAAAALWTDAIAAALAARRD
ncbi:MAG: sialate O-acetylesterase [Massilia sp.]